MDPFSEETYWNATQVLAWVYLGDRESVRNASSANDDHGSFFQEVRLPDGETAIIETPGETPGPVHLAIVAAWNGGTALPSYDAAKRTILAALVDGQLHCWGLANGAGDLVEITPLHWAGLDFYFTKASLPYAAPPHPDHSRPGATHWHGLKFRRDDVLVLWPDPLDHPGLAPPRKTTVAAEKKCQEWLEGLMRSGDPTKNKGDYQGEAIAKFDGLSNKGFLRAWGNAAAQVNKASWTKPGPRSA